MDTTAPMPSTEPAVQDSGRVPAHVWIALLAVASAVFGVQWDIAWHRSIGRDTFWSPPHLAIYLGGVLAGLVSGYLILSTTFARTPVGQQARQSAVRIWGFRGPLGAFLSAWGGMAMLASAPFDNWWHNTYGLDVTILSPPHTVLALGIIAVELGGLILISGARNHASESGRRRLTALFLAVGGLVLVGILTFQMEFTGRVLQHGAAFYRAVSLIAPLVLLGVGRASGHRFGATLTAAVYSAFLLLLLWTFPLVSTTPKLGPVYFPTNHLVPEGFPILLLVPALGMDLVQPALTSHSPWRQAAVLGFLFLAGLLAAQWPMADFLMSPAARTWVFGAHYQSYDAQPHWTSVLNIYTVTEPTRAAFYFRLLGALATAVVSARLGLGWAAFLRQLRR
jgi:hypothetical protein